MDRHLVIRYTSRHGRTHSDVATQWGPPISGKPLTALSQCECRPTLYARNEWRCGRRAARNMFSLSGQDRSNHRPPASLAQEWGIGARCELSASSRLIGLHTTLGRKSAHISWLSTLYIVPPSHMRHQIKPLTIERLFRQVKLSQ